MSSIYCMAQMSSPFAIQSPYPAHCYVMGQSKFVRCRKDPPPTPFGQTPVPTIIPTPTPVPIIITSPIHMHCHDIMNHRFLNCIKN